MVEIYNTTLLPNPLNVEENSVGFQDLILTLVESDDF